MKRLLSAVALVVLSLTATAQITEWGVRPMARGESLRWSPGVQIETLATWPDGTPRLVETLKGRGGIHKDLLKLWFQGISLRHHPDGGALDLRKHIRNIPKRGPLRLTTEHRLPAGQYGSFAWWLTFDAEQPTIYVELVWTAHDTDLLFEQIEVMLPPGWTWTPDYPDPAAAQPYLVRARSSGGSWVLPSRMSRPFMFAIHPRGTTPAGYTANYKPSSWANGGYLQRDARVGVMPGAAAWVQSEYQREIGKLVALQHVWGGSPGECPGAFMIGGGSRYGGMTSGFHRVDLPHAAVTAADGKPGLGLIWIELLRYRTRQVDWEALGHDGLPNGARFTRQGGTSRMPIDAARLTVASQHGAESQLRSIIAWDPMDAQHIDRMSRATIPGYWIFGRQIFKWYLVHDAMKVDVPRNVTMGGNGTTQGREGANAVDILAAAYAVTDGPLRMQFRDGLAKYEAHWRTAKLAVGTPLIARGGVIVTRKPLGLGNNQALCYGFRGEEHNQVLTSLYGLHRTTDIDATGILTAMLRFSTGYAWRAGRGAPWGKYPLELINGTRLTSQAEWPTLLPVVWQQMLDQDQYQGYSFTSDYRLGNHFGYAEQLGVDWTAQLLEHANHAPNLAAARQWIHRLGPDDLDRYADTLGWLDQVLAQPSPVASPTEPDGPSENPPD